MTQPPIILKEVETHNLKKVDLTLEHNQLIVLTGVSGSGKSSLAFDTIYVEGQRRYVESLSTQARRHMAEFRKPDAKLISGLSPTIAIEQKTAGQNPRSTVGTLTGIYDFLRVLFAKVGTAHCPVSGDVVTPQSAEQILNTLRTLPPDKKLIVLAPFARNKKGSFKEEFADLLRKGFTRVRLDGQWVSLEEKLSIDGKLAHNVDLIIDRITLSPENDGRLTEAVTQALDLGEGLLSVFDHDTREELFFSEHAHSAESGLSYPPLQPSDFSFNHPSGMCPGCQGLGITQEFDLDLIIDENKSLSEDCCSVASSYQTVRYGNIYASLASLYGFKVTTPWKKIPEKGQQAFLWGIDRKWTKMRFVHPQTKKRWIEYVHWKGVLHEAKERFLQAKSDLYKNKLKTLMHEGTCSECQGARIRAYPAATTVGKKRLHEITALSIDEAFLFFTKLKFSATQQLIAEELLKEIVERLKFLQGVGLHYLSLERGSPTLSGGESQRVRLASQIGSGLVCATYVLDEPSIGLHPRDNTKLIQTLQQLKSRGNTVIVVEHDEETICAADTVVEVGPLAGQRGGQILCKGRVEDLLQNSDSLTGAYLSGRKKIPIPKRRKSHSQLKLTKASHHNLKKVDLTLPLGVFVAVTGVSGSGKSSLITDTLYPCLANKLHRAQLSVGKYQKLEGIDKIDKVIAIDQKPIGRTPRSNPATFVKVFDEIRDLFSQLPESAAKGYKAGRFSFNVKQGSCPHCSGMGMIQIDMDFMEDEWVTCEHCRGERFDTNTLSILYKGKNIYEVLEMTIEEAKHFFSAIPSLHAKLSLLTEVGLDYLKLGQPSPTLSGGEAQRIKLAKELSRPSTGSTLYILDEPTTGLHFHDIHNLIHVLQKLVDKGNTVLVIEHNMDLVKTADWIIDLGHEGGKAGGEIIASGTPESIVKKDSPTALALKPYLKKKKPPISSPPIVSKEPTITSLIVEGASQNNLKRVSASIPRGQITLCTGPSGSGKSSFAFETIYAEGQRRYAESMSAYARQFVSISPKPKVDQIDGLSAAIAIEQKIHAGNPRSTIGTLTEIYDYLRILYAYLGIAHCPETKEPLRAISKDYIVSRLCEIKEGTRVHLLSPIEIKREDTFEQLKERLLSQGFLRIRLNDDYYELDEEIPFDRQRKNALFLVIDRFIISKDLAKKRLFDAVDQATHLSKGSCVAATQDEDHFFHLSFTSLKTGKSYAPITPHSFSFNTESGMCLDCEGIGIQYGMDLSSQKEILALTPLNLLKLFWKDKATKHAARFFLNYLKHYDIPSYSSLTSLTEEQKRFLFDGVETQKPLEEEELTLHWKGFNKILSELSSSKQSAIKQALLPYCSQTTCPSCKGTRLNPLARHVTINELSIADLCALPLDEALIFLKNLALSPTQEFLTDSLDSIITRLHFLQTIGVDYLSLNRSAPTLSGGEMQRIRLARQLGSQLTGCLYVLDEPTIGLHPDDNAKLNQALKALVSLGNTLLLVEHDPLTVEIADYILDFGPKAGKEGGEIVASGTLSEIKTNPHSLTGAYLSGKKTIPYPQERRKSTHHLSLEKATLHNVHDITLNIPLQTLTCLSGVSGSGKSTLLTDLLLPAADIALKNTRRGKKGLPQVHYRGATLTGMQNFDQLLVLSQDPIGQTQRADVSTYADLLTSLRYHFASLPEAIRRGLAPKHFSFNHKKGMCTTCQGLGTKQISLQFLPPVKVVCDSCKGFRLNPLSLQVTMKGKHLGHVFKMTVEEALEFLPPIPKVVRILETLISVGLGYLQLGQEIATLSGGEAQRIRLSKELSKRSSNHTLYLLDEPTVGLHPDDIAKLLPIFHTLVDRGNTLIIIEHNLDILANADHLIEMGPGAGKEGGQIVMTGTPEEIAKSSTRTASYLKKIL